MSLHKFKPLLPLILLIFLFIYLRQIHMLPERFEGSPRACERNAKSCSPCDGAVEGKCMDNKNYGWNNSISADLTGPGPAETPDGRWRRFKMPNYYGWGPSYPHYYGEPYYARSVKY